MNNTAATPTIYEFQHNGLNCVDIINSDYNLNKCMNSMLIDISIADANIPNNCKALLNYDINVHACNTSYNISRYINCYICIR
jgi:hypothetical protein